MGPRLSKISYKMSECEKKLGYLGDEDEGKSQDKQDCERDETRSSGCEDPSKETVGASASGQENPRPSTSTAATSYAKSGGGGGSSSSSSQYQSNSSLSSGSGEVTCVQLPWSKSSHDKSTKKRKPHKTSKSPSPSTSTSVNPVKLPTKRSKTWHRFSNCSKKKDTELEVTSKSSHSACVCTGHRRVSSEAGDQSKKPGETVHEAESQTPKVATFTPPGLRVFNPDDYPIEDEDEKMRRQRAKEMAEGVELTDKFGVLSFKGESSYQQVHTQVDYIHCLVPDLKEITSCSFYWGKIDRYEAEKLLEGKPEGTFLLRDSAQEEYLFSVSFRRYGRSLHARIEQWGHSFSFDAHDPSVFSAATVTGLIEHYKDPSCCMFFEPMLTTRLHRNFTFDLQHLARSVICNHVTYDAVNSLPLPKQLKTYCKEYHYKQRVRVRHFAE